MTRNVMYICFAKENGPKSYLFSALLEIRLSNQMNGAELNIGNKISLIYGTRAYRLFPNSWVFLFAITGEIQHVAIVSGVWPLVWVWSVPVALIRECACHSKLSSGTTHSVWSADPCFTCEINTLPFKARSASYSTRSLLIYRNFLKLSLKGSRKKKQRRKRKREKREKKEETSTEWVINSRMPLTDSEFTWSAWARTSGALNETACEWAAEMQLNQNQFVENVLHYLNLYWMLRANICTLHS